MSSPDTRAGASVRRVSRRAPNRLAAAACLSPAILLLAAWFVPVSQELTLDRTDLDADGRSTARAHALTSNVFGLEAPFASSARVSFDAAAASTLGVTVLRAHDGTVVFRAGHRAGTLVISAFQRTRKLVLHPNAIDADEDGFPDAAELLNDEDRSAFTAWFTAIAEAQATALDDGWATIHHDCAGLVRFAFREALKTHDRAWLSKRRYLPAIAAPDVAALRYPDLPFIGELPFRRIGGTFDPSAPIAAQFTAAASARTLWQLNSVFVSREVRDARAGDLLFFSVPDGTGSRLHSMIVLGAHPGGSPQDPGTRVVYHTGYDGTAAHPPAEEGRGVVRLVSIDQLLAHPDPAWHPIAHNPRFLGVHRLAIAEHTARSPAHFAESAASPLPERSSP